MATVFSMMAVGPARAGDDGLGGPYADNDVQGTVTGGDVCRSDCGPGADVAKQAKAKMAMADAYSDAYYGDGSVAQYEEMRASYRTSFADRLSDDPLGAEPRSTWPPPAT
ncbi:MAG: hypothetical protein ACRDQA_30645 [Nocardioidaceae bacterium]